MSAIRRATSCFTFVLILRVKVTGDILLAGLYEAKAEAEDDAETEVQAGAKADVSLLGS